MMYKDGQFYTLKGNLKKNQERLLKERNVQLTLDPLNLSYKQFQRHIKYLTIKEKNDLFFKIYDAYLYANTYTNNARHNDFYKGMAKMKRYEKYLYIIIEGGEKDEV